MLHSDGFAKRAWWAEHASCLDQNKAPVQEAAKSWVSPDVGWLTGARAPFILKPRTVCACPGAKLTKKLPWTERPRRGGGSRLEGGGTSFLTLSAALTCPQCLGSFLTTPTQALQPPPQTRLHRMATFPMWPTLSVDPHPPFHSQPHLHLQRLKYPDVSPPPPLHLVVAKRCKGEYC